MAKTSPSSVVVMMMIIISMVIIGMNLPLSTIPGFCVTYKKDGEDITGRRKRPPIFVEGLSNY